MKRKTAKEKKDKQKDSQKDSKNENGSQASKEERKIIIPSGSELMSKINEKLVEEEIKFQEHDERDPIQSSSRVDDNSYFILRKRDLKASQKGKVNLEKIIYEHEKKKLALEEANLQKQRKSDELNLIREDIGKKLVSLEPKYDRKTHWNHLLSEMKWMANDFERERKDHKGNSKKLNRSCKKQLDEK